MADEVVIAAIVVAALVALRRAVWGAAPRQPVRLWSAAAVALCIHIGFHTAATAAASVTSVIALVLGGWTFFALWTVWLSRAPKTSREDGDEGGGDDGGSGGGDRDGPPPDGGDLELDVDWDAFEREFWPYVDRGRDPVAPG